MGQGIEAGGRGRGAAGSDAAIDTCLADTDAAISTCRWLSLFAVHIILQFYDLNLAE